MFSIFHKSSSNIHQDQRVLDLTEEALMKASLQFHGYTKVGQVLHLQGPYISLGMLASAVNHLQSRHPFLRSRLQKNPKKANSYVMEEDNTLRLNIREISRRRDDHLNFWRQEWKDREKETSTIGQGLTEFWLLQDPDDNDAENAPREIVIICEHSVCDGISLSTVAHELLLIFENKNMNIFNNSLEWPISMETAIYRSLSFLNKLIAFIKFMFAVLYWLLTSYRPIARIPLSKIDFPLDDMALHCYTEASYGTLNKIETQKLIDRCHRENVTVTSAIASAILCTASTVTNTDNDQATNITCAIAADSRRRCLPPVSNHDLSYQVSGIIPFVISNRDVPTTIKGMWQLAKTFWNYVRSTVANHQILAIGMILGKLSQKSMNSINLSQIPTCGISNWGILPFHEQYGKWTLTMMTPIQNLIRAPFPFAFIQTVNGVLTIGFIAASPIVSLDTLERLRNGTIDKIHQMIED